MKHEIVLELDFYDDMPGIYVYCSCSNDPLLERACRDVKLEEIEDIKWRHLAEFRGVVRVLSLRARRPATEGTAFISGRIYGAAVCVVREVRPGSDHVCIGIKSSGSWKPGMVSASGASAHFRWSITGEFVAWAAPPMIQSIQGSQTW